VGGAKSKLIYVVEDDEGVRGSTHLLLEALGFAARAFASAEDFLAATDGSEADCLVLDHHLAGLSGLALLELLRAKGVRTPAIMVSANAKHLARDAARAGVAAVLHKPLATDALVQWLAETLQ